MFTLGAKILQFQSYVEKFFFLLSGKNTSNKQECI